MVVRAGRRCGVVGLLSVVAVVAAGCSTGPREVAAPQLTQLQTAVLGQVAKPADPPPARYTRTVWTSVDLDGSAADLDACRGPIAIDLGDTRPVLVAEHDYCGGSSWVPRLNRHDAVHLAGDGLTAGTYVVTEIRYQVRKEARVSDLPDADVVLQTCISDHEVVLVGMDLFDGLSTA